MKSIHTQKNTKITFASVTLASVLCAISIIANASAEDLLFTVTNNAVIQLTVPSLVNLNLYPTTGSDFNMASMDISVGTNNPTGYTLTMTADSDTLTRTGSITDGSNNTYTPTILPMLTTGSATGYTAAQFESSTTDAYTLNRWGYKLSTATNFMPMTTTTTELSTTNAPSNGDTITLDFAAKVDTTKPAGTYQTTLNFAAVTNYVPPCAGGKICYSPSADSVADTMSDQSVSSTDTSTMLWPSNFKRPGYGFAGWTDKEDWVLGANDASGNGTGANAGYHIYGPMQTIEFTAGQYSTAGLPLYAVWVKSAGSIQNWSGCSSLAQGAVTALTDQRDNNTYAVAKLADGKCWMIENLRLDSTNSDNATGALAQGYGASATYGNFIGLANPETANFSTSAAANSVYYSGTQSGTAIININTTNYPGYRMPRFRNDNTNTNTTLNPNTTETNMTDPNQNIYSYGNYYSWPAAKANTDYLLNIAGSNAANTSICPKGWRLPKGGDKDNESTNEFWSLVVTGLNNGTNPANYSSLFNPYYNGAEEGGSVNKKLRTFPNNFVYSGVVNGSSVNSRGSDGNYWSATASGRYNAYYFNFNSTRVYPGTYDSSKYNGRSVRCVAGRPTVDNISDLTYMQEFKELSSSEKANVLTSMTTGQQYQLKDNRDEKTYYISKLADGNVWMTQNLDHDIVTTANFYTPQNTDIPANWTASTATYAANDTTWNGPVDEPESYDPGDLCWNGTIRRDYNGTIATETVTCGNDKHYHIGNYYNWTAAVAMNDSSTFTTDEQDVDQSICPAGWRLPTYSGDKSYANLRTTLSLTSGTSGNVQSAPAYFVYGGDWDGESYSVGGAGLYWSSVVYDDANAYGFRFSRNGRVDPQGDDTRDHGNSVRCVAR